MKFVYNIVYRYTINNTNGVGRIGWSTSHLIKSQNQIKAIEDAIIKRDRLKNAVITDYKISRQNTNTRT